MLRIGQAMTFVTLAAVPLPAVLVPAVQLPVRSWNTQPGDLLEAVAPT